MKRPEQETPEELSDFYWRRAASMGWPWLALVLLACLDAMLSLS